MRVVVIKSLRPRMLWLPAASVLAAYFRPNMVLVRDLLRDFFLSFFGDSFSSSMYFGL